MCKFTIPASSGPKKIDFVFEKNLFFNVVKPALERGDRPWAARGKRGRKKWPVGTVFTG